MSKLIYIAITSLLLFSCTNSNTNEEKIAKTKVDFAYIEFHKEFQNANEEDLEKLQFEFPYLFPEAISNEEWFEKKNGFEEQLLYNIVDSVFKNTDKLKNEITELYKHIKFYEPEFSPPKTFTIINNLDYENSVIYADSLAFISLDMFLGNQSEVYNSFPSYISNNYTPENITIKLAEQIINQIYPIQRKRSFLESIVFYGKKLYLSGLFLPKKKKHLIFGIPKEKHQWYEVNESEIWKYFVSNQLLFSTDNTLSKRFIDVAPFSKFYFENDKDSPGGIGKIIGYNIVKSYMDNNKKSISEMLNLNAETILKLSKYKPSK